MKIFAMPAAVPRTGFDVESRGERTKDKQPDAPFALIPSDSNILPTDSPGTRSNMDCVNDRAGLVTFGSVEIEIRRGVLRISRLVVLENASQIAFRPDRAVETSIGLGPQGVMRARCSRSASSRSGSGAITTEVPLSASSAKWASTVRPASMRALPSATSPSASG